MCPIINGTATGQDRSYESLLRTTLDALPLGQDSLFASFSNTYTARFYVLTDVFYESKPGRNEHLKSQYLVFTTDFHGDLDPHLREMWNRTSDVVRSIWLHCVGFDDVDNADDFVRYLRRCQVNNSLLFNGSTDQPLAEQLKGLYLKQEFGEFAASHQHLPAAELKLAFSTFLQRVEINNLERPTWRAGATSLESVVVD